MDDNNRNLLEQFFHLQWYFRRYMMQHLREFGPMRSPYQGQGRILALLKIKPQISQKELSKILNIRSQSLGELLAKLERQGYITRTPSPEDRRGMDINLTEAGKAASEEDVEPGDLESVFNCLNEEEKTALNGYLNRLIERLRQAMPSGEAEAGFGRPDFGDRDLRDALRRGRGEPPFGFGSRGGFDRFFGRDDPRAPFHEDHPETPAEDEA